MTLQEADKWYEDNIKEVKRWAELEGAETGDVMGRIDDLIHNQANYITTEYYIASIKELKDIFDFLQENFQIIEYEIPVYSGKCYALEEI